LLLLLLRRVLLLLLLSVTLSNGRADHSTSGRAGDGRVAVRGNDLRLLLISRLTVNQTVLSVSLTLVHQLPDLSSGLLLVLVNSRAVPIGMLTLSLYRLARSLDGLARRLGPLGLTVTTSVLGLLLGETFLLFLPGLVDALITTVLKRTSSGKDDDSTNMFPVPEVGRRSGTVIDHLGSTSIGALEHSRSMFNDALGNGRGQLAVSDRVPDRAGIGAILPTLDVRPRRLFVEGGSFRVILIVGVLASSRALDVDSGGFDPVGSIDRIPTLGDQSSGGNDGRSRVRLPVSVDRLGTVGTGSRSNGSIANLGGLSRRRVDHRGRDGGDRSVLVDESHGRGLVDGPSRRLVGPRRSGDDGIPGHDASTGSRRNDCGLLGSSSSVGSSGRSSTGRLGRVTPVHARPPAVIRLVDVVGDGGKETHVGVVLVFLTLGDDAFRSIGGSGYDGGKRFGFVLAVFFSFG
jgi:hypothetical protein